MREAARRAASLLGILAAGASTLGESPLAAPPVHMETQVTLRVEAMVVEGSQPPRPSGSRSLQLGPDSPASVDMRIPAGGGGPALEVTFEARLLSLDSEGEALVRCATIVRGPTEPVRAGRDIAIGDQGAALFEIYGDERRRVVLTLRGETVQVPVVGKAPRIGSPVRFEVAVERVDGDRVVLLETNGLHTFVGQSVEYSFRRGQDAGLESVRLLLLPVSVSGDVVTIEAEISGALPSAAGATLVSHRDRIVASRGATSSVSATAGVPPAGYRFQVTPEF